MFSSELSYPTLYSISSLLQSDSYVKSSFFSVVTIVVMACFVFPEFTSFHLSYKTPPPAQIGSDLMNHQV